MHERILTGMVDGELEKCVIDVADMTWTPCGESLTFGWAVILTPDGEFAIRLPPVPARDPEWA